MMQVESRRQVVKLQKQLEQINAYNIELVIDICGMKEKFHQMTEREKHVIAERVATDAASQTVDSSRQRSEPDSEQADSTIRGNESGLVAMEHFASVWSAHDDDDLADDVSDRMDDDDGEAETPNHVTAASMRSSLRSGIMGSLDNDSGELLPQNNTGGIVSGIAAGGAALLGRFVYARKSSRMILEDISKDDDDDFETEETEKTNMAIEGGHKFPGQEAHMHQRSSSFDLMSPPESVPAERGSAESWRSFAEESSGGCLTEDDASALDKAMESDDLVALEAEAMMLAEQFKMTGMFLESVSDLQKSVEESGRTVGSSNILEKSMTVDHSKLGSPQRSVNKSTASTEPMHEFDSPMGPSISPLAREAIGIATIVGSGDHDHESFGARSVQKHGQPSDTCIFQSEFVDQEFEVYDDDDDDDDQHHLKPPIPFQYQYSRRPPTGWLVGQRQSLSSSPSNHDSPASHSSKKNISYSIADWAAVGLTSGLLADLSDSTSTSSYAESHFDSASDLGDTVRSVDYDVRLLDPLVVDSDSEAVKTQTGVYDASSMNTEEEDLEDERHTKIRERKEKKRELEAWKLSLTRSFEKYK
jgi:hypothetical protein